MVYNLAADVKLILIIYVKGVSLASLLEWLIPCKESTLSNKWMLMLHRLFWFLLIHFHRRMYIDLIIEGKQFYRSR